MNYSVFKLQNQAGRPAIFWEKESIPKNNKKFGYKNHEQRFPVRRYPDDSHHVDNDLVSLSPDDPPPKPAKNFIKRNRQKVTAKKDEPPSTVTLTQEQLNAILKSVGKVASGSENAVKITVDKYNDAKEIIVVSPRRHDAEEEYDDLRSRRRKKKPDRKQEDQGQSIYSFLDGKNKAKADSDIESTVSEGSVELQRFTRRNRHRKSRKSQRQEDEEEDDYVRGKNRRNRNLDIDNEDNLRDKRHRSRNRSNNFQDEIDNEIDVIRRRNKSKTKREDNDSDYESRENRRRLLKHPDSDNDDDIDRDFNRKNRTRKSDRSKQEDHSKERRGKLSRSRELELDIHNESINKDDDDKTQASSRDKIGLPMDLSWRHMTKAERRRLEMARQKLVDDEEKKEEDRIKGLNAVYDPSEVRKKPPQRHQPTRSDPPATRQTKYEDVRGRETEVSNYTDGNRRGRRSPSDQRSLDRSPELPSYTTPDTSPKAPVTVSRHHMTLAEKKRLEWDRDRVESVQIERGGNSDPWGRPGAGAPLRTRSGHVMADYKGRQDQVHNEAIPEEESSGRRPAEQDTRYIDKRRPPRGKSPPPTASKPAGTDQAIPITMRSSFVLGEAAPDYNRLTSAKERERRQWLADLEKQIEEKRQLKAKHPEVREENTWADKFGQQSYRAPLPEQPKETVMVDHLSISGDHGVGLRGLESYDVQSAPDNIDNQSYIRGQNAPIDPFTKTELEEKRKMYLEHQTAVKAQVEEKERGKRFERERKMKEDMEEERKLQEERESLQKQFDIEQQKIKLKEQQRQAQVNQLKAAMDEAQAQALQEKYQRKMQHLEAGGHDTTKLREHLEALDVHLSAKKTSKVTPRDHAGMTVVEPSHIPGLDLGMAHTQLPPQRPISQRDQSQGHYSQVPHQTHDPYMANRVLTPSRYRNMSKPWSDPGSPRREFGTQTGKVNDFATDIDGDITELLNPRLLRDDSEVNIEYRYEKGKKVRVISAPKEALERRTQKSKPPPSYRKQPSPHEHHHKVRNKLEKDEDRRKKKLDLQRRKEPVELDSRPMWGYKNAHNKKPKKQSEKDPYFEQKKHASDARRDRRERQLLAMVEANKPVIPDYYIPKSSRSRSRGDASPYSDVEIETPREVRPGRRSKSHSPNRLVLQSDRSHGYGNDRQRNQSQSSPPRGRADLPAIHDRSFEQPSMTRNASPPVPALKHKTVANQNNESRFKKGGKYGDVDPLDIPVQNGEFVPFTRTIEVLDPTKAEEPVPFSREGTDVANARRAYYEGLHPEKFGNKQYVFQDKHRVLPRGTDGGKDYLMNPSLLLDHPTSRQDEILVQLSTLKQSLMQRQRELETFSPSDLVRMDTDIRA